MGDKLRALRLQTFYLVAILAAGCQTPASKVDPEQLAKSDEIYTPGWAERMPTSKDILKVYPERALREDVRSSVKLTCVIRDDWALDCERYWEEVEGYGFAEAALEVSHLVLVRKGNTQGLAPGKRIIVPVRFALGE